MRATFAPALDAGARRRWPLIAGVAAASLAATTALVAALEGPTVGIVDASPVYLLAVVVVGSAYGTVPAVLTAVAAFVLYDVLFTEPRLSLLVADPREWLDLLLFLVVAMAIGRLVAVQRARADEAAERAAEASSLFTLSRLLATATSTDEAAGPIAERLRADTRMDRVRLLAGTPPGERVLADTGGPGELSLPVIEHVLQRMPGDAPARWVRTHGTPGTSRLGSSGAAVPVDAFRVRIEIDGQWLGSVLAVRARSRTDPGRPETRILALAADQLASGLRRDELRRTATDLEVARQADVVKSAVIDAISHDLRTPLAGIRATAGGLGDPDVTWSEVDRRAAAAVIDREAARLDALVGGLLHLGRIASGALHADLEPHEPWSLIQPAVDRLRPAFGDRDVTVSVPDDLPPVMADAALVDSVVTNLVDNALRHTPPDAPVRLSARARGEVLEIAVEDGGTGSALARGRSGAGASRAAGSTAARSGGLGIGLRVVHGLVDAMGGTVVTGRSELGGRKMTVRLRAAAPVPGAPREVER